jgi:hypothetical protein
MRMVLAGRSELRGRYLLPLRMERHYTADHETVAFYSTGTQKPLDDLGKFMNIASIGLCFDQGRRDPNKESIPQ